MRISLTKGPAGRRRVYLNNTRVLSFRWTLDPARFRARSLNRRLRAILGDTVIHVLGDSHTGFFSGNEYLRPQPLFADILTCSDRLANFKTFHLGPSLAYHADSLQSTTRTRDKVDHLFATDHIPPRAAILCIFGEIDLRVHVFQQTQRRATSYQAVVDGILARYSGFLLGLRDRGCRVIAWGPVATGDTRFSQREFTGTEAERNAATAYFNDRLAALCRDHDLGFLSLFNEMLAPCQRTRQYLLSDGCHLSQKAWPLLLPKLPALAAFLATPPASAT